MSINRRPAHACVCYACMHACPLPNGPQKRRRAGRASKIHAGRGGVGRRRNGRSSNGSCSRLEVGARIHGPQEPLYLRRRVVVVERRALVQNERLVNE
eukprot:COSAG01_NODE_36490_length_517_cov_0.724880_2_plen_97_part_01